jgi:hypothetical protein
VVGQPLDEGPAIEALYWSYEPGGNVEHIATHEVTPDDVRSVLEQAPRFFANRRDPESIIAVGPNPERRFLATVLSPTFVAGEWVVETAYWLGQRGEELYKGGRINEG